VLIDLKREDLEAAFGPENERRLFAPTNLLDQAQVDAATRAAVERYGRIDVVCNIAGGFRMGEPIHQTSDRTWDFLFDINARSLLYAARSVVPLMIDAGGGKIVNVGAYGAKKGVAHMGSYCAAKSSVIRMTEDARAIHGAAVPVTGLS